MTPEAHAAIRQILDKMTILVDGYRESVEDAAIARETLPTKVAQAEANEAEARLKLDLAIKVIAVAFASQSAFVLPPLKPGQPAVAVSVKHLHLEPR